MIDYRYALYAGGFTKGAYPTTYFTLRNLSNPQAGGFVCEIEFCLEALPSFYSIPLFHKYFSGGGALFAIHVTTSNRVTVSYRTTTGSIRNTVISEIISVNQKYKVIVNADAINGVKAMCNTVVTTDSNIIKQDTILDSLSVLYHTNAPALTEQLQGWVRNIRFFKNTGYLTDNDIHALYGGGNFVRNRNLSESLRDKSIYELRCNQSSGDYLINTGFLNKKRVNINVIDAKKKIKGGGLFRQVEFEAEEVVVDDFEPIYQLAMVNAVPENYQTRTEAEVLQLNYVHDPVNYQFSATTTNGSWVRTDVPLESRIVGDLVFSTTDGNGANVLSLVDGQTDGIAFWFSSTNNFRMSIFHSGGTQQIFNFGTGAVPFDETEVRVRYLIYNNSGTQAIKIWTVIGVTTTLVVNATSDNLIDGFLWQLGQFKNTTSNRLNGSAPTATEGVKSCVIWRVNKATQPSDAEVLALELPEVPEFQINRYELSGVANVAGMVRYNPLFFDESGATKYPVMMWFHGSGDGRNNFSLTRIALITIMVWLRQNNVEFIVLAFQSTTGGWEGGRINDCCDYVLNETTGLLKDYVDYSSTLLDVCLAGYSAGANGLDYFMSNGSTYLEKIKCIAPIAGVLNDAVSHVATLVSNGNYIMVFCVTNDTISGTITSKNLIEDLRAIDASRGSIVEFSDFLAGESHSAIQDLIYNNTGNVEPQQSGSYGTTGVYRVWSDTTWWNDVRTVLETGTL